MTIQLSGDRMEKMLMKRFFSPEIQKELAGKKCKCGFTIEDIIQSGLTNKDSSIGVYAGDEACYSSFAPLFDKIIETYHNYSAKAVHQQNLTVSGLPKMPSLDKGGDKILSTRIRVARNLKDFPLPPALTDGERKTVEQKIIHALSQLRNDLSGSYYPLYEMDEKNRIALTQDHFLFKKGDRFLEAAGVNRDWPSARGIFHSTDKKFLVWINEEDQLRIISMEQGGDLHSVFDRLARAILAIEEKLVFAFNDHLGYITSCPTNLGTAMRASVHVRLPNIGRAENFHNICDDLGLSARGIHGEHSEAEGGVWDISNKQRLGITEVQCVKRLYEGVKTLIETDEK